jgi:enoyl-CoA hydratase/carnithine racemase
MGEYVTTEREGRVAVVTIDNPPVNALKAALLEELEAELQALDADASVGAIVVRGGGERAFVAGADIKEFPALREAPPAEGGSARGIQKVGFAIDAMRTPVIAQIHGFCLGGGLELAMACDIRIAAEDAQLGQPEVLLGIIPGAGGTQRLSRLVGPSRAKDLIYTGRFVKADEALAIGLVDRVVPKEQVYDEAVAWAAQFSGAAALALRAAKESIDRGLEVDLDTGLEIERTHFAALFATEDRTTGMRSFVEQGPGKATFEGR